MRVLFYVRKAWRLGATHGIRRVFLAVCVFCLSRLLALWDTCRYWLMRLRYSGRREPFVVMNIAGSAMKLSLRDKGVSKQLLLHHKREFFSTDFMQHFVAPDEVILDIGANIGYYALMEARLAHRGAVFAIEPVPFSYALLRENLQLNNYTSVTAYHMALSDQCGTRPIYIYDKLNWSSFEPNPNGVLLQQVDVPLLTVDEFVRTTGCQPTMLRMDVEGHEYEILRGAARLLRDAPRLKLFMELHPTLMSRDKIETILQVLETNQFTIRAIFLEMEVCCYAALKWFNALYHGMGLRRRGPVEPTFDQLRALMLDQDAFDPLFPMVFLERNRS